VFKICDATFEFFCYFFCEKKKIGEVKRKEYFFAIVRRRGGAENIGRYSLSFCLDTKERKN
jgi:hypothetical protein